MFIFTRSRQLLDFHAPHLYDYTLAEVAQCLYRLTRFSGHRDVSVLEHTMWMYDKATEMVLAPSTKLAILLHDAPEAFTGDITAPVQAYLGDEARSQLHHLQERIMRALVGKCLPIPYEAIFHEQAVRMMKHLDSMALWEEPLLHYDVTLRSPDEWINAIEREQDSYFDAD